MRQKMADMVHRIQDEICEALREIDGVDYRQDEWTREERVVAAEAGYFLAVRCSKKPE